MYDLLYSFCYSLYSTCLKHSTKKEVTTMLTYPWKCTVLHCNHLGNTWKPLVLMTGHFDYCPSASEGDNQSVRSSAPVVSRCFPGGYNVKLYISRGWLAWWLLAFLHSERYLIVGPWMLWKNSQLIIIAIIGILCYKGFINYIHAFLSNTCSQSRTPLLIKHNLIITRLIATGAYVQFKTTSFTNPWLDFDLYLMKHT